MKRALERSLNLLLSDPKQVKKFQDSIAKKKSDHIKAIRADHQKRSAPGESIPDQTMRVYFGE